MAKKSDLLDFLKKKQSRPDLRPTRPVAGTSGEPIADQIGPPAPPPSPGIGRGTPPSQLLEALHQGQDERVAEIINQSELGEAERMLLEGILAAWREDSMKAEKLLD